MGNPSLVLREENLHVADGAWPEAFGGEGMGMGAYCITDAGGRKGGSEGAPKSGERLPGLSWSRFLVIKIVPVQW